MFRTNKNAPNYRIIVIDFNKIAESEWTTLIEENPKDVLDDAHVINNTMLVVTYLKDVRVLLIIIYNFFIYKDIYYFFQNTMHIFDIKTGKKVYDFNLDIGTVFSISGKRYHTEMFYSFCSFLTPNIIYRVEFNRDKINEMVGVVYYLYILL